jgi:predicted dehydrogenase
MTKALVIGYGSIGSRHARILKQMKIETAVLSSRTIDFYPSYKTLHEALNLFKPDYIVIANKTSEHRLTVQSLKDHGYAYDVLVEKPLFMNADGESVACFRNFAVAYNLRYHPALQALKKMLVGKKTLSVHAYVGKYLPEWRLASDYRQSYSAKIKHGGGVLRDLSHELDYLCWLFGEWKHVSALGGKFSDLEIESADTYGLLLSFENASVVTLQLNYLDRLSRRELMVNTSQASYKVDLIANTLQGPEGIRSFKMEKEDTYRLEHEALLGGNLSSLCSYEEGMRVMKLIEAAEKSTLERCVVAS